MVVRACRGFGEAGRTLAGGVVSAVQPTQFPFFMFFTIKLEEERVRAAEFPQNGVGFFPRLYDPHVRQSVGASWANRRQCSPCARKSGACACACVHFHLPCALRIRVALSRTRKQAAASKRQQAIVGAAESSSTQWQRPRGCGVVDGSPSLEP